MRKLLLAPLVLFTIAGASLAQDDAPAAKAPGGTLKAARVTEMRFEIKNFQGEWKLKSIVAPGATVKAGDVLAELDSAEFGDAMTRASEDLQAAELGYKAAQEADEQHKRTFPLQLARAKRDMERSADALDYFIKTDRANRVRDAELGLESFRNNVEDQEEELRQLEILYKGNDLAKESQDIVLNRSKRRLAQSRERLAMAEARHKRWVDIELPRTLEDLTAGAEMAKIEYERLSRAEKAGNGELAMRLVRAERALKDAHKRRAELAAEKDAFKLTAAYDGIVLVGGMQGNDGVSAGIKAGDKLNRGQVVVTLLDTSKLLLNVDVPLAKRADYAVGKEHTVSCADLGAQATGKVVARAVIANGGRLTVQLEVDNKAGNLMAGANATVGSAE